MALSDKYGHSNASGLIMSTIDNSLTLNWLVSSFLLVALAGVTTGCEEEVAAKNQNGQTDILPPPSDAAGDPSDAGGDDQTDDTASPQTDTDDDEGDEDTNQEGSEDTSEPDPDTVDNPSEDTDSPSDTSAEDTSENDTPETSDAPEDTTDTSNTANPTACLNDLQTGNTFEIDLNGETGQLYSQAAFNGEDGVWVVYAVPPAGSDNENVYAAKVRCDGTVSIGPKKVNTTTSSRDYEPAIDIVQDRVYIVWTAQPDGRSTQRTYIHILNADDGRSMLSESKNVTPVERNKGDVISSTVWDVDVTGLPGGGAVVAGSYLSADRDYPERVFLQRIDDNGQLSAPIIHPYANEGVRQKKPSVTAKDSSSVYLAWERQDSGFEVLYREVSLTNPQNKEPETVGGFLSSNHRTGRLSTFIYNKDEVYLAYMDKGGSTNKIDVTNIGESGQPILDFGGNNIAKWPNVAASRDNGGAVTWLRKKGSGHKVIVQGFSNAGSMKADKQVVLPNPAGAAHPPYGPGVTHVTDDVYFVTWSRGPTASDAKIEGRFVDLQ